MGGKGFKMNMYKLQVGASDNFRTCRRREMDCVRKLLANFLARVLFEKWRFVLVYVSRETCFFTNKCSFVKILTSVNSK